MRFSSNLPLRRPLKFLFTIQFEHICLVILNLIKSYALVLRMKNGRNTAGQFSSGNSGRPRGSRNKATIAIERLLDGQAEALTQTAIKKALEGDCVALRLCMDRIAPPPKDAAVTFSMSTMSNAMDASVAAGNVLRAVSNGELTPIEATRVMGLIDSYRRTLELTEIEERLRALEVVEGVS